MKYLYENPLIEGIIKSRPNRFIMMVEVNGEVHKCHCPSTGKIGSITFEEIPCLVSYNPAPNRKTQYTVEAFSLDPVSPKDKNWIGINQTKVNSYIDFFIKNNCLTNMTGQVEKVKKEVKFNESRLDFLINEKNYAEVKTLLRDIPCEDHPKYKKYTGKFDSFERLSRHYSDIAKSLEDDSKAFFIVCFTYDARPFDPPIPNNDNSIKFAEVIKDATLKGVERWQINLKFNKDGVELLDYFNLDEVNA